MGHPTGQMSGRCARRFARCSIRSIRSICSIRSSVPFRSASRHSMDDLSRRHGSHQTGGRFCRDAPVGPHPPMGRDDSAEVSP
jgi:hypothetical protein